MRWNLWTVPTREYGSDDNPYTGGNAYDNYSSNDNYHNNYTSNNNHNNYAGNNHNNYAGNNNSARFYTRAGHKYGYGYASTGHAGGDDNANCGA
jgi:hypothetical protein